MRAGGPLPIVRPAEDPTREELLRRTAVGDKAAFSDLYGRIAGRVLMVVQRSLLDRAQAEEVAQEVLLEVWQCAPRFDPRQGSALTWVLTIAHRRAVDRVRSSQSSRTRDLRSGIRQLEIAYDHVWETTEIHLEHERAARAMVKLSPLQREAIALTYFAGYTQVEMAGLLGVSVGTAKTRVRDGLQRLRNEMDAA
jgi:RNA polymerase sigma-70 factor (ECF subfamily)